MKIHIVEDDIAVADSLALVLSQMGHQPAIYQTGTAFLEAETTSQDRLILDIHLPDISAAMVLSHAEARGVQAVVITALGKTQIARELPGFDPERIIRKPIRTDALMRLL